MTDEYEGVGERLTAVRDRIAKACSTRAPARLIAVSKGHPANAIRAAYACGQRDFGENYVQELDAKARELSDLEVTWHFIGHLQRNKARVVAPLATMLHTIDRSELATEVDKRVPEGSILEVLLEVNVGREPQKSGCLPEEARDLARAVAASKRLRLRGLMTVPPAADDPEASRVHFHALRELGLLLVDEGAITSALELSMGMSHDFEVALDEGATMIRVGTDIFGPRKTRTEP